MLKGITYRKSKPTRALALLLTVIILSMSLIAPYAYLIQNDHIMLRFDVEDYDLDYEISYDRSQYDINVHIPGRLYYTYYDLPRERVDGVYQYSNYVVIDSVVESIASQIKSIAEGIDGGSDFCLASLILDFVRQTEYQRDINDEGDEFEYPKTPVETLVENGDCEDLAALFVSIALAAGLDAVLFMFLTTPGHMAAGVYIGDNSAPSSIAQPYWIDEDGKSYYFCECTNDRWNLGSGNYVSSKSEMTPLTTFPNA